MEPQQLSLLTGWTGFLGGVLSGAVMGLLFHREDWLGGYGSWRRRMLRLAHISFFGLGFINLAFALTAARWGFDGAGAPFRFAPSLLVAGAAAMPAVCYLAAWRRPMRHLFPVPVALLLSGVGLFLAWGVPS